MPVAYNVPASGIGVACAMRCDTDPSYYSGFDPYWVKLKPSPAQFPHNQPRPIRTSHQMPARSSRVASAGGGRGRQDQVQHRSRSAVGGGGGLSNRRSVSVVYSSPSSFSFQAQDKALSGTNRLCRMPEYNPFGDPHLVDYFARKFGVLGEDEPDMRFTRTRRRRRYSDDDRDRVDRAHSVGGKGAKRERKEKKKTEYRVTLVTGHQPHAGTSANIFVRLIGAEGKMPKYRQLVQTREGSRKQKKRRDETADRLMYKRSSRGGDRERERGRDERVYLGPSSKHTFTIKHKELGELQTLAIKHDGEDKDDDWFLKEVVVRCQTSSATSPSRQRQQKKWRFPCDKWLSLYRPPDFQASRKLTAIPVESLHKTDYEVVVKTADVSEGGTSANVFLTLYSEQRSTPRLQLVRADRKSDLLRGSESTFRLQSVLAVGEIVKIKLEHDNSGWSGSWCVASVSIVDLSDPLRHSYLAKIPSAGDLNWLCKKRGDKQTFKLFPCHHSSSNGLSGAAQVCKYRVVLNTGSGKGSGTSANVFLTLFGSQGDTGEHNLRKMKPNAFSKGSEDEFIIENVGSIGTLERLRVGHDNSGLAPGWYLLSVTVEEMTSGQKSEMRVDRWFAKDEDDKMIMRDIYCGEGFQQDTTAGGSPFEISVYTGDIMYAGTNAGVYVVMHGQKETKNDSGETRTMDISSGKLWLSGGSFERGKTDLIRVESQVELSPLTRLTVGHDNSGVGAGWFLSKVLVFCPETGLEQHFVCDQWLSDSMGDKLVERELTERVSWRKTRPKKIAWNVLVKTRDQVGAGTSARVYIQIYGDKGKSEECHLTSEKVGALEKTHTFNMGAVDRFKATLLDVGTISKLRIWHDNSGFFPGWLLEKVELVSVIKPKDKYVFKCDKWLSVDEDHHEIVRELPATGPLAPSVPLPVILYKLTIRTGSKGGSGTDANVFVTLFGSKGDSGTRKVRHSDQHINKFESGSAEECIVECVDLGQLNKVRIEHDNKNLGAGWFLDSVSVQPISPSYSPSSGSSTTILFPCHRWLATDEDDGQCVRELYPEGVSPLTEECQYIVSVKTGTVLMAGTDATVFIHIFGEDGDTGKLFLRNSRSNVNKFEQGNTDIFYLTSANIGKIQKVRLGHDEAETGSGWFVDKLDIDVPTRGEQYTFSINRWLDRQEDDGRTELELEPTQVQNTQPKVPFDVVVKTSKMDGVECGTECSPYLVIYGSNGLKSRPLRMENRTGNFEAGETSRFKFYCREIGEVRKIRVWLDEDAERREDGTNRDRGSVDLSWHIEKITVTRPPLGEEEGGENARKKEGADRDLNGSSTEDKERDKRKTGANQKYSSVSKRKTSTPLHYLFQCKRWLSLDEGDQQTVAEFAPVKSNGDLLDPNSFSLQYEVTVNTGVVEGASAKAAVSVCLYGSLGDTGMRRVRRLPRDELVQLEAGGEGVHFSLPSCVHLGELSHAVVRLESSKETWFLDSLHVEILHNKHRSKWLLPCQRWLGLSSDEGQVSHTIPCLSPQLVEAKVPPNQQQISPTAIRDSLGLELRSLIQTYTVHVYTGSKQGGGTNANVYIHLNGEKETGSVAWLNSRVCTSSNSNLFESDKCDSFEIQATGIGYLEAITIGHDDSGVGSGWFLEMVKVECLTLGRMWTFPCGRWLATSEDDSRIERKLPRQDAQCTQFQPFVPYEVVTETSDLKGAGTDSNIFLAVYGGDQQLMEMTGGPDQHSLEPNKQRRKHKFNKGQKDTFIVEMEDVQESLRKVRVGHSNMSRGNGWHLHTLSIRKMIIVPTHSVEYKFKCDRWLDYGQDDKAIVRELVPSEGYRETVDLKRGQVEREDMHLDPSESSVKYEVFVYTGKESGAGTDANVFITLFGQLGDSGERKLAQSSTHMDKFEKGNMDQFALEAVDLGRLYKLDVRHDNSGLANASWYLDRIEVKQVGGGRGQTVAAGSDVAVFHAERWLSKDKSKNTAQKTHCTLYAKGYEGDRDSVTTMGTIGMSTRGSMMNMSMSSLQSSPGKRNKIQMEMPVFEGPTVPYTIKVETDSEKDCGTTANAYIVITGVGKGEKNKDTGKLPLILKDKEGFEPGCTDTFSIEAPPVNEIKQITLGHDGVQSGQGWFVKSVEVDMPQRGVNVLFPCDRWLAKDKDDGLTERTLNVLDAARAHYKPKRSFELSVQTGDLENAGTDCRVCLVLFGLNGTSAPIYLKKDEDTLERASMDIHQVEIEDIVPLRKMRVSVEPKGARTSWYLQQMSVRDKQSGKLYVFKCDDWFDPKKKLLKRDLSATVDGVTLLSLTSYVVRVKTSDVLMAGTDANVFVVLFGENGDSDQVQLRESKTYKFDKFERDHMDEFHLPPILSLGNLSKLRISHDNSGLNPSWHLDSVEVEETGGSGKKWRFPCNQWLSNSKGDKTTSRDLLCDTIGREHLTSPKTDYEVVVRTTDKRNASTRCHAFLKLIGDRGESEKPLFMINSHAQRIFRGGDADQFSFSTDNVGKLQSIVLGHIEKAEGHQTQSPSNAQPADGENGRKWHCYDVTITNKATRDKWTFVVNDWISLGRTASTANAVTVPVTKFEQGKMSTLKTLSNVKYKVDVFTGNEKGAGTDANVFITIYGQHGDSGKHKLSKSDTHVNKFEKGKLDTFHIQVLDLGSLERLVIEHDNSGFGAGWMLDRVEITNESTKETTVFPCGKWLDKDKGDGQISRELVPRDNKAAPI
ncbi:lipoxygenase homology domain-containing protein 1-like isoform X2 [Symsagittifera roscoffensis]|uniref:lipoxygenase homology domain-containing protein 1-like isoform X2 n=1 Tax=Symsagittifera roscoffensis TaxID=84072 RepID=UPI00307C3B2C